MVIIEIFTKILFKNYFMNLFLRENKINNGHEKGNLFFYRQTVRTNFISKLLLQYLECKNNINSYSFLPLFHQGDLRHIPLSKC
jgi:hypothetical protein